MSERGVWVGQEGGGQESCVGGKRGVWVGLCALPEALLPLAGRWALIHFPRCHYSLLVVILCIHTPHSHTNTHTHTQKREGRQWVIIRLHHQSR